MIKREKIVFLINDLTALGGTERMCCLIASELASLGFDVSIISHYETKPAPFFRLHQQVKRAALLKESKKLFHHFKLPFMIYRTINALNPDVIISCDTQMCIYSSIPLMNKKHIVWEHFNSSISTVLGSRWFGRRLSSIFCKKIVVLTDSDKAQWVKSFRTKSFKIDVIPNPLPIAINKIEHKLSDKNTVLAVGRMTKQKGFDLLIQAWAKIDVHTRKNWTLRIVGPAGSAKPEMEQLIEKYQLSEEVKLVAAAADIEQEYQNAALYVLSSRYEGFGLTLIEAMSQGLPVIAFDCPMGPKEILDDKYGKLLPPCDVELLANAMDRFMQEPELRAKYSELAYQRSQNYRPENIIQLWQSLIQLI